MTDWTPESASMKARNLGNRSGRWEMDEFVVLDPSWAIALQRFSSPRFMRTSAGSIDVRTGMRSSIDFPLAIWNSPVDKSSQESSLPSCRTR